jgi:hypothetical protein
MDAKVAISVGEFDRGGKTRLTTIAEDSLTLIQRVKLPLMVYLCLS